MPTAIPRPGTFVLGEYPLSVLNRALEIFGVEKEDTLRAAQDALISAEGRKDATGPYSPLVQAVPYAPLHQAVAEYLWGRGSDGG